MSETAKVGDNHISGGRLRSFIDRIEKLEEDKQAIQQDLKEVYSEAKDVGYDTPTIRKIIRERRIDSQKRREQYELFELYAGALGMEL